MRTGADARKRFERFGPRYRALILVVAYGGLRSASWQRCGVPRGSTPWAADGGRDLVDLNGELSFEPPKTKNGRRTVPLPRRIIQELAAHMEAHVRSVQARSYSRT
jgi:hypothetical protein